MSPPQAKIFQIYGDKTFLRQKFVVLPPGRIENFQFLPKTYFSLGILKSESPPGRTLSKILISPQNFGEKWHYGP